jgi:hypothetical protein
MRDARNELYVAWPDVPYWSAALFGCIAQLGRLVGAVLEAWYRRDEIGVEKRARTYLSGGSQAGVKFSKR